jgi:putative heme iron utilization protein
MPESLLEVKARVVRELRERQCKRIRELRPERDKLIRETIEQVRVRVSAEQRLRTENRVRQLLGLDVEEGEGSRAEGPH